MFPCLVWPETMNAKKETRKASYRGKEMLDCLRLCIGFTRVMLYNNIFPVEGPVQFLDMLH